MVKRRPSANPNHIEILNRGGEYWNLWRKSNPTVRPDDGDGPELFEVQAEGINRVKRLSVFKQGILAHEGVTVQRYTRKMEVVWACLWVGHASGFVLPAWQRSAFRP